MSTPKNHWPGGTCLLAFLVFLFSVLMTNSAYAAQQVSAQEVPIGEYITVSKPSGIESKDKKEQMEFKFQCIGKHNGEIFECSVESEIVGFATNIIDINSLISGIPDLSCDSVTQSGRSLEYLFAYGWHKHGENQREFTFSGGGSVSNYQLNDNDGPSRYKVEGETDVTIAKLSFDTPPIAGILHTETILTVPESPSPSFRFAFPSGFDIADERGFHIVGIDGLQRMPGCPDGGPTGQNYILSRMDTNNHPEAHWGTQQALKVALDFANTVAADYGRQISYNDLSLPTGGQHDLHGGIDVTKGTHRNGNDIDLNARSGMGYDCVFNLGAPSVRRDLYLHHAWASIHGIDAISEPGGPNTFPNLDCYQVSGKMHIDVAPGR